MERKTAAPSLIDGLTADLGGPRTASFLDKASAAINFEALAAGLRADMTPDQPNGGRPFTPLVLMIKALLLAKWFNLSDPQLEEQLLDRLSFRRFVGLGLHDATPDETCFVVFRRRLRETGHGSTLFEGILTQLRDKGLVLKEGSLVDATIIEQARGGKDKEGVCTRDRVASHTRKHGRSYHGFKASVSVSLDGFVTDYLSDTAKVHDSRHIDGLIKDEDKAVYADSAYMSEARSEALACRGVRDGIVQRRVRGQKELRPDQVEHDRRCAELRSLVEHPFAWMKQGMGWRRARYRGARRNGMDFGLLAGAYNIKRSLSRLGMPLCPVAA